MAISQKDREEARGLYVVDGCTFDQVAKATGISASTLKIWSDEEGWQTSKSEYRETQRGIWADITKLRKKFAAKAVESLDPQDIYALVRLENVAMKQVTKKEETVEPDIDRPKIFLEDMEYIAETLKEIDPEGLKVFARNLELIITRFKEKHAHAT